MGKFTVFSGFLGAGKTTVMMALTKYCTAQGHKAAMITNDLGSRGLADHRLAMLSGCNAGEIAGDCICYQTEALVELLEKKFAEGCALVFSDIPGFGVGALDHVYHTLADKYPGRFTLSPFTVLIEPRTVKLLEEGVDEVYDYLWKSQLQEADLIVLNKCDLLEQSEIDEAKSYLRKSNPEADVICISAVTGQGLEQLSRALLEGSASLRKPEIGYGGPRFLAAMETVSEYNMKYYAVVCCRDFDGNAYLRELAAEIQKRISSSESSQEVPHLKLLAWDMEGNYGKVDVLGKDRPVEVNHRFLKPCTELAVVLNSSAVCRGEKPGEMICSAVEAVSDRYQLTLTVYQKEFI